MVNDTIKGLLLLAVLLRRLRAGQTPRVPRSSAFGWGVHIYHVLLRLIYWTRGKIFFVFCEWKGHEWIPFGDTGLMLGGWYLMRIRKCRRCNRFEFSRHGAPWEDVNKFF